MQKLEEWRKKWVRSDFYENAIVLGVDIGIEGLGVYLRKGPQPLWARTYLVPLPESAPLRGRRLKRSARRARKSRKHREVLLKQFCSEQKLPWIEVNGNPFELRLRALKGRLASKEALVVCIRHIIRHRGYDYHLMNCDEGGYPWGEELDIKKAVEWAESTCCKQEFAESLIYEMRQGGFSESKLEMFEEAMRQSVARYNDQPIRKMLEAHAGQKSHLRPSGRKHNFPRELVWDHLVEICTLNSSFLGGERGLKKALPKLKKIIDYHRREPGELAERKVKACDMTPLLFPKQKARCDTNDHEAIRRFKLLDFLATRTFETKDHARVYCSSQSVKTLLERVASDVQAVVDRKERPSLKGLRTDKGLWGATGVASDKDSSHNKDFFDQLNDLLKPKLSLLKKRASMSGKAAEELIRRATEGGSDHDPQTLRDNLKEYYLWRRNAISGYGIYPQVELLLGKHPRNGKLATEGLLRRIFREPAVRKAIGKNVCPDYVVIECAGDAPRNDEEVKRIQTEQKDRRAFKETLFAQYKLADNASETDRKKVLLFDQQRGICPYTGKPLGKPLDPGLQIDHVFPRNRGGISEMINLVLTHSATNSKKGDRTPAEARGDFPQAFELAAKMQWNGRKRELFLRTESQCPDWQNLTRVAQLARQLREEAARWLGILGTPEEMARRIGTPSGFLTAVCRESWKERLIPKNRGNYRHHMWDAAVLSHIPPGPGLNHAAYGGIFYHAAASQPGQVNMKALPELGPDMIQFEKDTADLCLVEKKRQRKSKQARTAETIYGRDGQGRLWSRENLMAEGMPVKQAEEWLKNAGIPTTPKDLLPRRLLEKWLASSDGQPLRLANKTVVHKVPSIAAGGIETALIPHKNHLGQIIGYKKATESYLRYEIWRSPKQDKHGEPIYQRRLIPHPRGLAALRQRNLFYKQKIDSGQTLRQIICGTLDPWSKKVGVLHKGDLLWLPLDDNGDICMYNKGIRCWLWYRVSAINRNGQVEMKLVEYKEKAATPLANCTKDITTQQPQDPKVLAYLMSLAAQHDSSSHPRE